MKKLVMLILALCSFSAFAEGEISLKNIQLKDLNNNVVSLDNYQGKNVYIKMWASWCPICLAGLAEIDDLTADDSKDFTVITIASPGHKGEKSTEKFIEWYKGLDYKNIIVLLDEQGEIIKRAKVRGYPSNLFLDSELNLKKTMPGHLDSSKIKEMTAR